jgi:hypothetical protein
VLAYCDRCRDYRRRDPTTVFITKYSVDLASSMSSHRQRFVALIVTTTVLVSGLGFGVAGTAIAQQTDEADGQSNVRVVHAAPDAGAVDVYVDDQRVLDGVELGQQATVTAEAGNHTVTITEAGNESVVLSTANVSLSAGTNYTVAATDASEAAEDVTQTVFVDDAVRPEDDEATVRVVHGAPEAGPVDVTIDRTGGVLADNVTYRNASEYVTIPAGNYTLDVRPATADDQGEIVATFNVSLEGGTAVSAFAVGFDAGETQNETTGLGLLVLNDSTVEAPANVTVNVDTESEEETPMTTETEPEATTTADETDAETAE